MEELLLLPPLLSASPEAIAFYRNTVPISYATMRDDIAAARQALMSLETPEFVLFDPDAYAFTVWMLACWQNGQTALLVTDELPATRARLPLPWVGNNENSVLPDWSGGVADAVALPGPAPQFDRPGLVVFTSGSSGTPSRVFLSAPMICRDALAVHQVFGNTMYPNTRFVGSVPHHHMYGVTYRLLWPLFAGYPIVAEQFHHPEELKRLPAEPHLLICTPTLLKRLAQLEAFSLSANISMAISAGSPLQDDVAIACSSRLGAQMIDVFGSSETLCIMHRSVPGGAWREHAGITLAIDEYGCLKIRSPFLNGNDWYYTQDLAERDIDGDGWRLLGRADRVAKIEGQRVGLDALEAALLALPEVAEARSAPLYRERDEIVAAVVLSEEGRAKLLSLGKMRFDRWMRQRLSTSLALIAIPRRWRYLTALPYNAMSKITTASIVQLFERQALPPFVVDTRTTSKEEMVWTLALRDCMHAFDGHFPEAAVLPGVTQVDWALRLAQRHFSIDGRFSGFRQLRFQRILRPDDEVSLSLRFLPEKKEVRFAYTSKHGVHSQGQALFAHTITTS